jgi:outer membrane receptor protein involved in Fe transport
VRRIILIVAIAALSAPAADGEDFFDLPFEDLLEISVSTASKKAESVDDAPGVMTVISRREIESYGANNVGQLLNKATSAIFLSANIFTDNQICLRKQSLTPYNTHILVLLDGRPLRDPITRGLNNSIFAAFPVDALEKIEIIRGPGSVLYGTNAYAGVINLVSRTVSEDGTIGSVGIMGGSFETIRETGTAVHRNGALSLLLSGVHWRESGPEYHFTSYGGIDSTANWRQEYTGLLAKVDIGGLSSSIFISDFNPQSLHGLSNSWMPHENLTNNRHTATFYNLGYEQPFENGTNLNTDYTFSTSRWFQVDADFETNSYSEASEHLLEISAQKPFAKTGNVICGATLLHLDYSSEYIIDNTETDLGAYFQIDHCLSAKIKFIGGFQYNKPEKIDGKFSPRLGAIVNISPGNGAKLLYSTAFRSGSPLEKAIDHPVFRGNQNLAPELIDTTELELFHVRENYSLSLTGYYSEMRDVITRVWVVDETNQPYGGYLIHLSGDHHKFYGVEFEGKALLTETLTIQGSCSFMRDESAEELMDYTLHPNLMAKLGVRYSQPNFSLGIWNSFFGSMGAVADFNPDVATPNKEAADYHLLSVKGSINLNGLMPSLTDECQFHLTVSVNNLLDEDVRYPEFTTRGVNTLTPLMGGRAFYGGATVTF